MTFNLLATKSRILFTLALTFPVFIFGLMPLEKITSEILLPVISGTALLYFFWIYKIGGRIIVRTELKTISLNKYRNILFYIMCYVLCPTVLFVMRGYFEDTLMSVMAFLFFLSTVTYLFLALYIFYILSIAIVSIELHGRKSAAKILGTFILFICLPFTIWFLYGKVIRVLK